MNLYRFFKRAYTITFILQVICAFFILIYFIFLSVSIALGVFSPEIIILMFLIAIGASCLVTLLGIGTFIRIRDKFIGFLGTEEEFPSQSIAEKIVLGIWIAAILIFGVAIYYGLYLAFSMFIYPNFGQNLQMILFFIFFGVIIICFILQGFIVIMARFSRKVVKKVLVPHEKKR